MNALSYIEVEDIENSFFGAKARQRRQERRDKRHQRKMEKIGLRGQNRMQGGGIFSGIGDTVKGVFGGLFGGGSQMDPNMMPANTRGDWNIDANFGQQDTRDNTTTYIVVGVILLIIIAVVFYMMNKKKSK